MVDPITKEKLELVVETRQGDHILKGKLLSKKYEYKISNGIVLDLFPKLEFSEIDLKLVKMW